MLKNIFLTCYLVLFLVPFLFPGVSSAVPEGINLTWPGGAGGPVTFDGTVHAKRGLQKGLRHGCQLQALPPDQEIILPEAGEAVRAQ
jgi:hypothetical protein